MGNLMMCRMRFRETAVEDLRPLPAIGKVSRCNSSLNTRLRLLKVWSSAMQLGYAAPNCSGVAPMHSVLLAE